MKKRNPIDRSADFEEAMKNASSEDKHYVLRLYVTGSTVRSTRAIQNIRNLCEEHLQGRYELEVIDIHQQPNLASSEQIIAAPTLIKKLPVPLRTIVGDLSHRENILLGLNIHPRDEES